ncbi:N-acetylmuramoyl-L-alanine amidase [Roseobacter sp. YSTF-M11]|uniref:N-acetylmuramoyl-L-alanine amidase n=1 Tax=Roseobacter insulae TaxID=2859783 RepID=A0A9X1G0B7_9RHOB|nr:N-acetylmuramoyl-L-alanine amidase [Roseobacter insulae]MBW4710747.1 N-acetylmuramoyl-L-alanine amidase [Roseobacter insulae]
MKIAIVVGHNADEQGAIRCIDGRTEFDWNSDLARLIQTHNSSAVRIFNRTSKGYWWQEIDRVYRATDAWGATVTAELHFNSVANPQPSGSVTLSSGTTRSYEMSELVQDACVAALNLRDRGVRILQPKDRGGRSLWKGRAPACMLEPYFGSNADDCRRADVFQADLARHVYEALAKSARRFSA